MNKKELQKACGNGSRGDEARPPLVLEEPQYPTKGTIERALQDAEASGDLEEIVLQSWHQFRRRRVADAWMIGGILAFHKKKQGHGNWLPWLGKHGISEDVAHRCMRLYHGYPGIPQLAEFGSVDAALKELPPAQLKTPKKITDSTNGQDAESDGTAGELAETPQTPKEAEALEHGQDSAPEPADIGDEDAGRLLRQPLDVGHTLGIYCGTDEEDEADFLAFSRFQVVFNREGCLRWRPVGIVRVVESGVALTYCLDCDAPHDLEYRGKTYHPEEVLDGNCTGVQVPWTDTAV